jgi:hypothetical protein
MTDSANIYLLSAIGDALGSALVGLKPEAIHAMYGNLKDYIDPEDHLSHRIDRWSKPGFYSYITQMNLLLADALIQKGKTDENIRTLIKEADQHAFQRFRGVFRNTVSDFHHALDHLHQEEKDHRPASFFACWAVPFACRYPDHPQRAMDEYIRFVLMMNDNPLSITPGLAVISALRQPKQMELADRISDLAEKSARAEENLLKEHSRSLEMSTLPSIRAVSACFTELKKTRLFQEREEAFTFIVKHASETSHLQITRPGHPHPLASAMSGILLGIIPGDSPEDQILAAAGLGQAANVTASIAGALQGSTLPPSHAIRRDLVEKLANYRQIILRGEAIADGRHHSAIKPFREMENGLTQSVALDMDKLAKRYPLQEKKDQAQDQPDDLMIRPLMPDRKDKRLWRDYEREKSKKKRRRRDFKGQ